MSKETTNKTPIQLFEFEKQPNAPSPSLFCQKTETYLRFSNLKYEHKDAMPYSAPKGKLPYITCNSDTVCDSQFIIRYLDTKKDVLGSRGDLDAAAGLTDIERSVSNAYRVYLEELLYFCVVQERFLRPENRTIIVQENFSKIPGFIRGAVMWYVRRGVQASLMGQGIAKHSQTEIDMIAAGIVDDLETKLRSNGGSGPWFNGAKGPCKIDASIFGLFSGVISSGANPAVRGKLMEKPAILSLVKHIAEEYFPEYEDLLKALEGK